MTLAILGGSFNPVHVGHLALADAVLSTFHYDRILLIPSFQSPFKESGQGVSSEDRLDLLLASVGADGRIGVDDCEIKRQGISYTIDTLNDIENRYKPRGKIGLVLGDDLIEGFPGWRNAEELAQRTDLILARRLFQTPVSFPYPHRDLRNDIISVASNEIRRRISEGQAWKYLVPPGARDLIQDRRLYGYTADPLAPEGSPEPPITLISRVEEYARSLLPRNRFLHSRQVALFSQDLCSRFGLPPAQGYLAGIAHDLCKGMADDQLKELALVDGLSLSPLEEAKPSLLHARAAAVLLKSRFGVETEAVLEAIRFHTTGAIGMGPLAKIVYVADKIEPSRTGVRGELRVLAQTEGLDRLFYKVLQDTAAYLQSKGRELSEETRALLQYSRGGTEG